MSWIGVDLDGTIAQYDHWRGEEHIGDPIPAMVDRVLSWLNAGKEVRIMTARAGIESQRPYVIEWCKKHLGREVQLTDKKDFQMEVLYDDRAIQVEKNTGRLIGEH